MTIKCNTREEWLTAAANELAKLYTRNNPEAIAYFLAATRWSCSAPKTRRARVMSTMYEPGQRGWASSSNDDDPGATEGAVKFEVFIRAEVSNEIAVLREIAINIHRIACTSTGSRYTSRNAMAAAYDVWVMPGAMRSWSDWAFDLDRASTWWADVGDELLGNYPHDQVSQEAIAKRRQTTRQLKLLCSGCGFIARCTWTALQRSEGTPTCACGTRTDLVDKDGSPILVNGIPAHQLLMEARQARIAREAALAARIESDRLAREAQMAQNDRNRRAADQAATAAASAAATAAAAEAVAQRTSDVRLADLVQGVQGGSTSASQGSAAAQRRAASMQRNWQAMGSTFSTPSEWSEDMTVTVRRRTLERMGYDLNLGAVQHREISTPLKNLVAANVIPSSVRYLGTFSGQPVFRFTAGEMTVYMYGLVNIKMDVAESYIYEGNDGRTGRPNDTPHRAPWALREIALSADASTSTDYRWPMFIEAYNQPEAGDDVAPTSTKTSRRWAAVLEDAADAQELIDDGQAPEPREFKISKRFAKLYDPENTAAPVNAAASTEDTPMHGRQRFAKLDMDDALAPAQAGA